MTPNQNEAVVRLRSRRLLRTAFCPFDYLLVDLHCILASLNIVTLIRLSAFQLSCFNSSDPAPNILCNLSLTKLSKKIR